MSRTDKHRPWWVQIMDPQVPHRDRHDHRFNDCTLEQFLEGILLHGHSPWDWRLSCIRDIDFSRSGGLCSCHMCHPHLDHGPERAYWRARLRQLSKEDDTDIDIAPFIYKEW
jgi:hypothetical protein